MTTINRNDRSGSDFGIPTTVMAQDIDWLHCQASLCKVKLFSSDKLRSDKKRKLVCFVDVSSLSVRERDQNSLRSESDYIEPPEGFDLEEREIVVIKDENRNSTNTEGAVCFFRQGRCERGDVMSWLSNDLQKYAVGFQHALTPSNIPQNSIPFDSAADTSSQNNAAAFRCSGA